MLLCSLKMYPLRWPAVTRPTDAPAHGLLLYIKKHRAESVWVDNESLLSPNLCSLSLQSLFLFPLSARPSWPNSKASSASGQSSPGKDAAPESSALHTTSSPTSQGRWLSASTAARSPVLGGTSGPEASRPAARLLPPSPGLATRPSTAPKVSPTIDKLPYVPHSPFHLFSYDFEDSPLLTKDKGGDSQTENR